jgi:hypothetical protein
MKITITSPSVGASGATVFTLADDSISPVLGATFTSGAGGQIKEGFVNKQKRIVQTSLLFRAAYLMSFPRFNLENRFAFTVQRTFQTTENCISFIAYHPDNVPAQGEITINEQSTTGQIARYLPNAIIESVECTKHVGAACEFQYTISGTGPWQTSP